MEEMRCAVCGRSARHIVLDRQGGVWHKVPMCENCRDEHNARKIVELRAKGIKVRRV